MNFFAHQDQARRQTRRMVAMFALAVVAIVVVIDLVVVIGLGHGRASPGGIAFISLLVLAVIASGSMYRIATLRGGGAAVAAQLGAREVPHDTGEFAYRRLRNVVEEIAIAAGVPVPQVFVLEDEAGINAFAAGYAPADAAITVTRGALDKLTREELQGVIGHEFSHVLNGDMRLNIRLVGVVFGILVVSVIGRKIAEGAGRGGRDSSGAVMFGLALAVAGYVGVVFGRILKASISRQREFLADASAVQFTRQTEGIAGALKKIGALAEGSMLDNAGKEEVTHMLFGDGVGYSALFATHPPLEQRIRRLDPSFRKDELRAIATAWARPTRVGDVDAPGVSIGGFAPAGGLAAKPSRARDGASLPAAQAELRIAPASVVRQVGNPGNDDRGAARTLRKEIPERLRIAAADASQAMPLLYALVLNDDAGVRARQLELVARRVDAGNAALAEELGRAIAGLHPMQRLPLAALAVPALRRRPRARLEAFVAALGELVAADGEVTLAEYCLARLVRLQVADALDPAATRILGRLKLTDVAAELKDVLAIVARYGHDDEAAAQRAYALGLADVLPSATIAYAPPSAWMEALDRALPKLDRLGAAGKELVVAALARAISADGAVCVAEAELLRTICAALHCPLPPLLQE
ncbi:MAG: M48 family metallopeptidase [Dokdonella sp.]|uniref:M48 family metallopeptidase n=1 Tax=Dokdonella sp. TaxID=2291710 RepID=UPI003F7DF6D0